MRAGLSRVAVVLCAALCGPTPVASAYPLEGYESTGIRRLLGIRLAQEGLVRDSRQPPGARLSLAEVDLRLFDRRDFDLPAPDADLTRQITDLLGAEAESYSVALLDLSDPLAVRYAEYRGENRQNVGSVGKLLVAVALFQALADTWPDVEARRKVLRETIVTADDFSQTDHHTVRFFDPPTRTVVRRTIRIGDKGSLYEYLDWMLSPSSNSAAGMVMREAMLVRQYGTAYPPSEAEIRRFFKETPMADKNALFERTFLEPVTRNGLSLDFFKQGSIFTHRGKLIVSGAGESYGCARELARYLVRLEEGRLVDEFSSREIKRLLYVTERRIRYAASPALASSAVYFKSGSLWECAKEPGFTCVPYAGNVKNYMNSVAIVEHPAGERRLYYMVTIVSNVLRRNSASVHMELATRIQKLVESRHAAPAPRAAPAAAPSPGRGPSPAPVLSPTPAPTLAPTPTPTPTARSTGRR
jgi:Beta-lactamase enzyme family